MRQLVEFVNYDNFEAFLLLTIELLAARNFLYKLLHNHSIVDFCLTWRHFNVIHTAEHNSLARRRRCRRDLELLLLTPYFVDCRCSVQRLQEPFSKCSLTTTGRTVEKDVWEVITLRQFF